MKKRILSILSLIIVGILLFQNNGLGLFDKKTAYAIGDLTVVWATTPLFNYSNIAPGFNVTKNVNVANGAPSSRSVGVRGILTSDPGNMDSVMNIEIKEGANVLYSDTLENFFDDSTSPFGIFLSNLNTGANTDYSFKVTFDQSAGNQFQNKSIVFDVQIGITIELPSACSQINFPNNPIVGTSGNDNINGTSKNDLIVTFEGNDKVNGGGGNDCIVTGAGLDTVDGGTGNDVIDLGSENDKASSGAGNDTIFGGEGNDIINGGSENDHIFGGSGKDNIDGGSGIDVIMGDDDDDSLEGGSNNDTLIGGQGIDKAKGGAGIDTCDAETENTCEF